MLPRAAATVNHAIHAICEVQVADAFSETRCLRKPRRSWLDGIATYRAWNCGARPSRCRSASPGWSACPPGLRALRGTYDRARRSLRPVKFLAFEADPFTVIVVPGAESSGHHGHAASRTDRRSGSSPSVGLT